MKNENKILNNDKAILNNGKFLSTSSSEEKSIAEAFANIRKILKDQAYNRESSSHALGDEIRIAVATYSVVINGLLNMYEHTSADLPEDLVTALQENWYKLQDLIEEREEEHSKIWNYALHGAEEPFK